MLYEDWLQADGDWCKSSIYFNSLEKRGHKKRGKWVFKPYKDVVTQFGEAIAKDIRKKKLEMQAQVTEGDDDWFQKHPEVDSEDLGLE